MHFSYNYRLIVTHRVVWCTGLLVFQFCARCVLQQDCNTSFLMDEKMTVVNISNTTEDFLKCSPNLSASLFGISITSFVNHHWGIMAVTLVHFMCVIHEKVSVANVLRSQSTLCLKVGCMYSVLNGIDTSSLAIKLTSCWITIKVYCPWVQSGKTNL